jgi:hypothetical protein
MCAEIYLQFPNINSNNICILDYAVKILNKRNDPKLAQIQIIYNTTGFTPLIYLANLGIPSAEHILDKTDIFIKLLF